MIKIKPLSKNEKWRNYDEKRYFYLPTWSRVLKMKTRYEQYKNVLIKVKTKSSNRLSSKKPYFWAQIGQKKFFLNFSFHNLQTLILRLCTKKSGKTKDEIFQKVQNTLFFGIFGLKLTQKFLFSEKIFFSWLAHFNTTFLYKKIGKTNELISY